ncbi:MAG: P-loop NTPase [Ornithinimicrobium sp.]
MTLPALTAITHRWEGTVAGHLGRSEHVHVARRCADLAELLGCVGAGVGQVAAVSVDLRGVDRSTMATLTEAGVRILGVYPPGDEDGERTLRRWGINAVLSADAAAEEIEGVLATLVAEGAVLGTSATSDAITHQDTSTESAADLDGEFAAYLDGSVSSGEHPPPSADGGASTSESPLRPGHIVAVWGPTGAPGRSTVAVNLASELAQIEPTMLVDADTYGASIAQMLAVLDEAPGIAAAARAADNGTLDGAVLTRLARHTHPQLQVLTGLPRADRWPELREHAVSDVLTEASDLVRWTIVDVASCLEQDEEISFDTVAPRRNGVTLRVLHSADQIVLVGTSDPIGLQRLVRAISDLREHTQAPCLVVVTRVRASAVGRDPKRQISEVLSRFAGIDGVHLIPEDQEAMDAALLAGGTLSEIRPNSSARVAVIGIAEALSGHSAPRSRTRSRPRWRKK